MTRLDLGRKRLAEYRSHFDGGSRRQALAAATEAAAVFEALGETLMLAEAVHAVGRVHYYDASYSVAAEHFDRSAELYAACRETLLEARERRFVASAHNRLGNDDGAETQLAMSRALATEAGSLPDIASALVSMAILRTRQGRYDESLEHSFEALHMMEMGTPDPLRLTEALMNVANVFRLMGRDGTAIEYFRRALETAPPSKLPEVRSDLGTMLSLRGELDEALALQRAALRDYIALSSSSYLIAVGLSQLGGTFGRLGRDDVRLRCLRIAFDIMMRVGERNNAVPTLGEMAEALHRLGRHDEALDVLHQALALSDGVGSLWTLQQLHRSIVVIHRDRGDYEKALEHFAIERSLHERITSVDQQAELERLRLGFELERATRAEEIRRRNDVVAAVITAQESERERIARDLHDGLGQTLAAVQLNIERHRRGAGAHARDDDSGGAADEALERATQILTKAIDDVRTVSHTLGSSTLRELGLYAALEELITSLGSADSIAFELAATGMEDRLPEPVELGLFRIAQELVTNIVRHAGATEATVQLVRTDEGVLLSVEDNGCGFDPEVASSGMGRRNILARVDALQGSVTFDSTPGHGTTVTIIVGSHGSP